MTNYYPEPTSHAEMIARHKAIKAKYDPPPAPRIVPIKDRTPDPEGEMPGFVEASPQLPAISSMIKAGEIPDIDNRLTRIEGAVEKLGDYVRDLVSKVDINSIPDADRYLTKREVMSAVLAFYGVTRQELMSLSRPARIAYVRQVGFYLCKKLTLSSLPSIAKALGRRDHTTAIHGIKKIEWLRGKIPGVQGDLDAIQAILATEYPRSFAVSTGAEAPQTQKGNALSGIGETESGERG